MSTSFLNIANWGRVLLWCSFFPGWFASFDQ